MNASRRTARFAPLVVLAVAAYPGTAQDTVDPPLHVAFVGDLSTDRGKDFVAFLHAHYARVDAVERATCAPDRVRSADVVVLDWSQQSDGVIAWLDDRSVVPHHPLGDLARWDRPTVLLGSAGLNTAVAWQLPGSFG